MTPAAPRHAPIGDTLETDPHPAPTAKAQTALSFTDDFSAAYDAVWISVSRVTVVSPTGGTELLRHDTPQLLNLPTLRRSGALVANASLPVDATEVRVYVTGTAQLQQLDGSMRDVNLQAPAGYLAFRLEGRDSRSGALALDFDLPNFSLQGNTLVAANGLVTLSVDRSNLAGATGSIQIDVSQASFKRGSAALLGPGLRIEAYLVAATGACRATVMEIEGAAKSGSGSDSDGSDDASRSGNGEIKGNLQGAVLDASKIELD